MRDIHRYIKAKKSKEVADGVILEMKHLIQALYELPQRGNFVKELEITGDRHYRELHCKPYRIIYTVHDDSVFIYAVIDGRRDLKSFLMATILSR